MILTAAAALVAISPLFGRLWNLETQIFFQFSILFLSFAWIFSAFLRSEVSSFFSSRQFYFLTAVFVSLFFSFSLSPLKTVIKSEWLNLCVAFAIIIFSAHLTQKQENLVYKCLKIAAIIIFAFALFETICSKTFPPLTLLKNPNSFALFFLMFLPLAAEKKDYLVCIISVVAVFFSASLGGMLAMLGVGVLVFRKEIRKEYLVIILVAVSGALLLFLDASSVSNRLLWWKDAIAIFLARPLWGWGYSSFTFVYPAFHAPLAGGISSIYAHNYFLEFLAENGFLSFFLWMSFIFLFGMGGRMKRFSLIAALLHSFVDFGLSQPFLLWIFCMVMGLSVRESLDLKFEKVEFSSVWAFGILLIFLAAAKGFVKTLKLENMREKALSASRVKAAERIFGKMEKIDCCNPLVYDFEGNFYLKKFSETRDKFLLFKSAAALEESLFLNPYNPGPYTKLEIIYTKVNNALNTNLKKRWKKYFRWERK